jgi:hypothetical protein
MVIHSVDDATASYRSAGELATDARARELDV